MEPLTYRHHGLLGTVIEVTVRADHEHRADEADAVALAEIERLQRVFDRFDDTSELRRWQRGDADPSAELAAVLTLAREWADRTGGAFDPTVGRLYELWSEAAERDRLPTTAEIAAARTIDLDLDRGAVDLNAIAKGWIVDRAVDRAMEVDGIEAIVVNAGGDLVHRGTGSLRVGIENPHRPYDNEPPVTTVVIANAAVATSGGARRFWRIGGERYPRVIDPRSGWPTDGLASASVVAPDAATADVLATVLAVLGPVEGGCLMSALGGASCAITHAGDVVIDDRWRSLERA